MDALGTTHPAYVKSGILSKKIKNYHNESAKLLPYLKEKVSNYHEISTEALHSSVMETVRKTYEPTIITFRGSLDSANLKTDITVDLSENHGYMNLDVTNLQRLEAERCTEVGQEM